MGLVKLHNLSHPPIARYTDSPYLLTGTLNQFKLPVEISWMTLCRQQYDRSLNIASISISDLSLVNVHRTIDLTLTKYSRLEKPCKCFSVSAYVLCWFTVYCTWNGKKMVHTKVQLLSCRFSARFICRPSAIVLHTVHLVYLHTFTKFWSSSIEVVTFYYRGRIK